MSIARVLAGQVGDGTVRHSGARGRPRRRRVQAARPASEKRGPAQAGETVALGKLDHAKTGDTLVAGKQAPPRSCQGRAARPVLAIAIAAKDRKDDVKLGQALNRLIEEDPSLSVVHNPETHEMVLWGQGEMHLRVALERLADRFGVATTSPSRRSAISETIRKSRSSSAAGTRSSPAATASSATSCSTSSRCRAARASSSTEKITGGVVPRNYIPSVEEGVIDALKHGPLGFPVVDVR